MVEKIIEIKIKKVDELNSIAQLEVMEKLQTTHLKDFRGYAKVTYAECSPLRIVNVEPINGTIIDFYRQLISTMPQKR